MSKTYHEKLLDPRWQKKRLEILERDGWECVYCCEKDETLHVHHGYYASNMDPWDYPPETLWTLCQTCHEDAESCRKTATRLLGELHPFAVREVCAYLNAKVNRSRGDDFMLPARDCAEVAGIGSEFIVHPCFVAALAKRRNGHILGRDVQLLSGLLLNQIYREANKENLEAPVVPVLSW